MTICDNILAHQCPFWCCSCGNI